MIWSFKPMTYLDGIVFHTAQLNRECPGGTERTPLPASRNPYWVRAVISLSFLNQAVGSPRVEGVNCSTHQGAT
jgi:hypothetical protein